MLSDEDIKIVEQDTREQAKGPRFFKHRAGRIGASVSGAVYHSNIAQCSQSVIKSVTHICIKLTARQLDMAADMLFRHMKHIWRKAMLTFKYQDVDCLLTSSIYYCMPHLIS